MDEQARRLFTDRDQDQAHEHYRNHRNGRDVQAGHTPCGKAEAPCRDSKKYSHQYRCDLLALGQLGFATRGSAGREIGKCHGGAFLLSNCSF